MKIACPKESKDQEFRVALTPKSVKTLIDDGHDVWIETQAGAGISCSDEDYKSVGAKIAKDIGELFAWGELIIKVKEPNHAERMLLRPEHTLFTYLHLASDPDQTRELIDSDAVCIAYETVTDDHGTLPLLTPMSEIAGRLSVQEAAAHLGETQWWHGSITGRCDRRSRRTRCHHRWRCCRRECLQDCPWPWRQGNDTGQIRDAPTAADRQVLRSNQLRYFYSGIPGTICR